MKKTLTCAGAALLALALFLAWQARSEGQTVSADAPAQVEKPMIALTFDDGPMQPFTTELLDGLAERGVTATFFLIGEQIIGNEELVRRMEREGHQVGIHTFDHVSLTGLNQADFDAQVEKTRTVLKNTLGHGEFALRPPYGLLDNAVLEMAKCPIILWSVDPKDWDDKNTQRIAEHIVSHAEDGAVILMHDIYRTSVDAALQAVDELLRQGYRFGTVEELFADRGIELQAGHVYRAAPAKE